MGCCSHTGSPPSSWVQGTSVAWTLLSPDHRPADGWSASTVLRGTAAPLTIAGDPTAAGDGWDFLLTSTQSASLAAGPVTWQQMLTRVEEVVLASSGRSTVCPNIATAGTWNPLTPAERWLEALLAIGPTMLAGGRSLMTVDGMTSQFRSLDEYNRALKAARQAVIDEKAAGGACFPGAPGKASGNRILARFTSP